MTKLKYKAPEAELIGLSTNEICTLSFNINVGDLPSGFGEFGGTDDGTHNPDANRWDHFDNSFDSKL
jgi:hypothetical protein